MSDAEVLPECDFAFAPLPVDGTEIAYKAVDAFCLAIALDLLDAGYKQSEVVLLMKYLRKDLESLFSKIRNKPSLFDRQRQAAKDYPDFPFTIYKGNKIADARVFLIIQKIERSNLLSGNTDDKPKYPTFLAPIYCHGAMELADKIADLMPSRRRTSTIAEIARTAQAVRAFLADAPLIKRGRPKSS
ncbi:MAG: hypothetical protein RIM72_18140 [Alphaproteobacteria bacterium]